MDVKTSIQTKIFYEDKLLINSFNTCRDYVSLRNYLTSLHSNQIPKEIKLSFMDDRGKFKPLDSQKAYEKFLSCTNGVNHFIECLDSNLKAGWMRNFSNWSCGNCETVNGPDISRCRQCDNQKNTYS